MQAHLGTDPIQPTGQKVCSAHPVLQRAKGVFHSSTSDAHEAGVQVQLSLHCFEAGFVIVPTDSTILAGRALFADVATRAV